jgi:subtilisin family serine protease
LNVIRTTRGIVAVSVLLGVAASPGSSAPRERARANAAEAAALQAAETGASGKQGPWHVAAEATAIFPLTGRKVQEFKLAGLKGNVLDVALDENLTVVDFGALRSAERASETERYGALEPALFERMQQFPNTPQPVIAWLTENPASQLRRPDLHAEGISVERVDQLYQRVEAARTARVSGLIAPLLERLRRIDPQARQVGTSPAIAFRATAEALATLARQSPIARIYLERQAVPETGEVAKETTGITTLQLGNLKGDGVRIALTEAAGRAEANSLLLSPVTQDGINVCAAADDHTTEVASIVKGRRVRVFGVTAGLEGAAPNADLLVGGSCSTNSVELEAASSRAVTWGARAISMSWGLDTQLMTGLTDRFYDDVVFNQWRTVIKSAGNRGCQIPGDATSGPGSGMTTSPGLGYNVITVGGFDDHDTPTWADDTMYVCSSFANPISTHGDREKPEVVAPTVNLTVTKTGPANLDTVSGTSGASPLVLSGAAIMIQSKSMLAVWPEIIRATLMATATHNIEGDRRLSDKDGAGGVNFAEAVSLLGDPKRAGGQWYACDGSTASPLIITTLTAGPRTRQRVVISWDTDPSYSNYSNEPSADIDLEITDPQGRVVAASRSFDDTDEIVDFDTFLPGTFTARAVKFRCDLPTWLGWAWHTTPMLIKDTKRPPKP